MISDTQGGEKATSGIQGISSNYNASGGCLAFLTSNGNVYNPNDLTERMRIDAAGNVSVGTMDAHGYKFAVNGDAIASSMTVKLYANWPDYVFKPNYHLPSLTSIKTYIDKNQHLPDMPSEQEVKDNGINLGEIVKVQTKKIEELTLYTIQQDARIAKLEAALAKLTASK